MVEIRRKGFTISQLAAKIPTKHTVGTRIKLYGLKQELLRRGLEPGTKAYVTAKTHLQSKYPAKIRAYVAPARKLTKYQKTINEYRTKYGLNYREAAHELRKLPEWWHKKVGYEIRTLSRQIELPFTDRFCRFNRSVMNTPEYKIWSGDREAQRDTERRGEAPIKGQGIDLRNSERNLEKYAKYCYPVENGYQGSEEEAWYH